jgi:hypothetical protein
MVISPEHRANKEKLNSLKQHEFINLTDMIRKYKWNTLSSCVTLNVNDKHINLRNM